MKQRVIKRHDDRLWTIRIVTNGCGYGLEDRCIHDEDEPLIEFYDLGYKEDRAAKEAKFGSRGQFVSRYNLSTLEPNGDNCHGLHLHGGVSQWWADGHMVKEAVRMAREGISGPLTGKLTDSEREYLQTQIDVLIADLDSPGMYLSDEDRRETREQVKILRLKLEARR